MMKFIKVVLIMLFGGFALLLIGSFCMLGYFAKQYDKITEEDSISYVEAYTGLDIDEYEFKYRYINGAPWGDDTYYDIKLDDEKILEQIKADTLWVKDSSSNIYNYQTNTPEKIIQHIKFDADSLILYFEEHYYVH